MRGVGNGACGGVGPFRASPMRSAAERPAGDTARAGGRHPAGRVPLRDLSGERKVAMRRTEIPPELVLVDPELRRHVLRQPSRADPAGWARFPSPHLHPPAPSPARRRPVSPWGRRRRAVLTVTAFALVAGTAFAIGLATGFDATVRTTAAVATTTTEGQRDAPRAGAAVPAIGAWAGAGAALTSRVVSPGAGPPATAERPRPRASPKRSRGPSRDQCQRSIRIDLPRVSPC